MSEHSKEPTFGELAVMEVNSLAHQVPFSERTPDERALALNKLRERKYMPSTSAIADRIDQALTARDAELAALRRQVEEQRRQIDALTASRKAYRNECAAFGMTIGAGCLDADAACRAAGVELEDRT